MKHKIVVTKVQSWCGNFMAERRGSGHTFGLTEEDAISNLLEMESR